MRQIIISLFAAIPICCFSQSKYDGKTIDKFYAELKKSPTEKAQWDFFNAFPDNYQDFDKIYTYNSGKNPYYFGSTGI